MASAPQVGANPRSWAVDFGASEVDGALTFAEAVVAVSNMKLHGPLPQPLITDRAAGDLTPGDLPLRFLNEAATKRVQFLDVVTNVDGPINRDAIASAMTSGAYQTLPAPFGLKASFPGAPYTMQLVVVPKGDKYTVVKMINFGKVKVHVGLIKAACVGVAMEIEYGKFHAVGSLAFNHMFDMLGGYQVRYWAVVPKGQAKTAVMTPEARAAGFAFIKEHGPKANTENQFVEWTEHHVNEPCPIQGWERALVKESLRNYAQGKVLAKTIANFPLTLKDIVPWFFHDVLVPFLAKTEEESIMWLGVSGVGKTPAAKTVAYAVSSYLLDRDERGEQPGFRTTKHLDFFRAEPGSIYKPDIFDDGVLARLSADEFKSFHCPAEDFHSPISYFFDATIFQTTPQRNIAVRGAVPAT